MSNSSQIVCAQTRRKLRSHTKYYVLSNIDPTELHGTFDNGYHETNGLASSMQHDRSESNTVLLISWYCMKNNLV